MIRLDDIGEHHVADKNKVMKHATNKVGQSWNVGTALMLSSISPMSTERRLTRCGRARCAVSAGVNRWEGQGRECQIECRKEARGEQLDTTRDTEREVAEGFQGDVEMLDSGSHNCATRVEMCPGQRCEAETSALVRFWRVMTGDWIVSTVRNQRKGACFIERESAEKDGGGRGGTDNQ